MIVSTILFCLMAMQIIGLSEQMRQLTAVVGKGLERERREAERAAFMELEMEMERLRTKEDDGEEAKAKAKVKVNVSGGEDEFRFQPACHSPRSSIPFFSRNAKESANQEKIVVSDDESDCGADDGCARSFPCLARGADGGSSASTPGAVAEVQLPHPADER